MYIKIMVGRTRKATLRKYFEFKDIRKVRREYGLETNDDAYELLNLQYDLLKKEERESKKEE